MTIEVRLERIYEAAHVEVPAHAELMSQWGNSILSESSAIAAEINLTGHRIGSDVAALAEELVYRFGTVVATMNDSSVALDNIADDFAATDAGAAQFFATHQKWLEQHHYDGAPGTSPVPTTPGG